MEYTPDNWIVLKISTEKETIYKIFGTWRGGYLYGDSWRMNSGIKSVEEKDDHYLVHGYSSSVYKCYKECIGYSTYTAGVLDSIIENSKNSCTIEVVSIEEF
jgi:hypothetical protein